MQYLLWFCFFFLLFSGFFYDRFFILIDLDLMKNLKILDKTLHHKRMLQISGSIVADGKEKFEFILENLFIQHKENCKIIYLDSFSVFFLFWWNLMAQMGIYLRFLEMIDAIMFIFNKIVLKRQKSGLSEINYVTNDCCSSSHQFFCLLLLKKETCVAIVMTRKPSKCIE